MLVRPQGRSTTASGSRAEVNPPDGVAGEIDAAISALPPGPQRDTQRMDFDALSLSSSICGC